MQRNNKVDVSVLGAIYKECSETPIVCLALGAGDDRLRIEVKHRLNANEVATLVDSVCDGVVDSETGLFRSELKDYYLRRAVLSVYTNLAMPEGTNAWDYLYGTPIFAMVTGHDKRPVTFNGIDYEDNEVIDTEQYEQILLAIDQKINYALQQLALNRAVFDFITAMSDYNKYIERGGWNDAVG